MSEGAAGQLAVRPRSLPPALTALLVQGAAALPVLGCALAFPEFPTGVAAITQGVLAAALARGVRQPRWWILIHLLFPVLLLLALAARLPRAFWGAAFIVFGLVYWSVWRTRVPLFLSPQEVWREVERLLPPQPAQALDIGSGLGGLVLYLAARRPDCRVSGVEIAPLPWLLSWLRARLSGSSARLLRGDYRHTDLSTADLVFAYLSPAAMPALWESLVSRMKPGALFLSLEFPVPGATPDFSLPCGRRTLYGWRVPERQLTR